MFNLLSENVQSTERKCSIKVTAYGYTKQYDSIQNSSVVWPVILRERSEVSVKFIQE